MTHEQFVKHSGDIVVRYQRAVEKLEAENAGLRAQCAQLQANTQQQKYEWEPSIGEPGYRPDGNHNYEEYREYQASKERTAEYVRQQQALRANMEKAGYQYDWDPMPGEPGFKFERK